MPYRPLAILLTLLVLVFAPLGARAEESPVKLGLTPVDVDGSYFDLEMEPGDVEVLTVELASFGEEAAPVKSFAADSYSLINGGFGVRLIDEPRTGTTEWLDYTIDDLTLEPNDPIHHTFTVEVPEETAPGDYLTSIVIQTAEPVAVGSGDSNVGFNQILRQAVAVAIDVPGPRVPALAINGVNHTSNQSRSIVRIGVENPGNQHLKPVAHASIETADGVQVYEQEIAMGNVYAGTDTAVEMILNPALEPGDYFANLELEDVETGTTASAERLPFTVEAPVEPEPATEDGGSAVGAIINDPRMPGGGGTGSLIWLVGMIAAVAGLAALGGIALGRRRGRQAAAASVMAVQAAASAGRIEGGPTRQQRPSSPTASRRPARIKPLVPPKSAG